MPMTKRTASGSSATRLQLTSLTRCVLENSNQIFPRIVSRVLGGPVLFVGIFGRERLIERGTASGERHDWVAQRRVKARRVLCARHE